MARVRIRSNEPDHSERGYQFQWHWMRELMVRLRGYESIIFKDAYGSLVTEKNLQQRGADGGIDLIIEIKGKTKGAAKRVETQVLRIIDEHVGK